MEEIYSNVQQAESLTGQVNSQAKVDNIVSEAVNQPSADEKEKAERLELLWGLRIKTDTVVAPERYALSVNGVGFFA